MAYLLDTNIVSELRKGRRSNASVARWFEALDETELFLSVLVIGEIQRGADRIRRRDRAAARKLDRWLSRLMTSFEDRILPVTLPIARLWGSLGAPQPIPTVDGLLAATARHHGLILATRNTKDVAGLDVECVNPFGHT